MLRKSSCWAFIWSAIAAAAWLFTALTARADVVDALNWARLQGCVRPAHEALRVETRLNEAAGRMASGSSLRVALSDVGYLATRSAAIQVQDEISDARLAGLFAKRDCEVLTGAGLVETGVHRRAGDVWVVLAAPVRLPTAADSVLIRQKILDLVNAARAAGHRCGNKDYPPVHPLHWNIALTHAALAHSEEMAAYNEFQHTGRDGSSPAVRIARANYGPYSVVGENIAAGVMGPAELVQGWLNSPPHCENIMEASFAEIGIAYAGASRGDEWVFWTQDFAAPAQGPQ